MTFNLFNQSNLEFLKSQPDNSIDSIVTDPPYGISFMGKSWDYDVPNTDTWKELMRVLKPGGHIIVACGTRTQHRMAVNIEDAGFEIRDIVAWVYGSGFPKSLNIGKAVDKLQGNEREVVGISNNGVGGTSNTMIGGSFEKGGKTFNLDKGNSPYEGWGTALKPAMELWTMARKPLSENTVAENVLKWGTGGINIDECRVDVADSEKIKQEGHIRKGNVVGDNRTSVAAGQFGDGAFVAGTDLTNGRFPANLIHDNSEEVRECFPETKSGGADGIRTAKNQDGNFLVALNKEDRITKGGLAPNSGNASRFFKSIIYTAKASKSERNAGLNGIVSIMIEYNIWKDINTTQQVKKVRLLVGMDKSVQKVIGVSGTESKNATEWNTMLFGNCTTEQFQKVNKSITKTTTNLITTSTILNWLTHLLTNDYTADVNYETENGGNLVENVTNYNTLITTINEKMVSALGVNNVVLGTQLKISVKEGSNIHSTVKPVTLMRYLARLITPKNGVVLDPYMGSGSTGIACVQEGFNFIGVEMDKEYFEIAKARIEHWTKQ